MTEYKYETQSNFLSGSSMVKVPVEEPPEPPQIIYFQKANHLDGLPQPALNKPEAIDSMKREGFVLCPDQEEAKQQHETWLESRKKTD